MTLYDLKNKLPYIEGIESLVYTSDPHGDVALLVGDSGERDYYIGAGGAWELYYYDERGKDYTVSSTLTTEDLVTELRKI